MGVRKTIDIEHLVADEKNPRFEAVSTEEDALFSILEDQSLSSGNKLLNLAHDIADNGLNASELLIVSSIEGTDNYRVREGNRRVAAIKLSLHSDQVPERFSSLAPRFKELCEAMQQHRRVRCYVCDDEEEIRRLLLLRHGGESNGVGTVKWNSVQTARFAQEGNQQTARALSLVEHLREECGQDELWRAAAGIPATNLGRLISTPEVRRALGVRVDGNEARYLGGHDKLLLDVLGQVKAGASVRFIARKPVYDSSRKPRKRSSLTRGSKGGCRLARPRLTKSVMGLSSCSKRKVLFLRRQLLMQVRRFALNQTIHWQTNSMLSGLCTESL